MRPLHEEEPEIQPGTMSTCECDRPIMYLDSLFGGYWSHVNDGVFCVGYSEEKKATTKRSE